VVAARRRGASAAGGTYQTVLMDREPRRTVGSVSPIHHASGPDLPPAVLQLAGHPVRWQLLRELARSDRRVAELATLVGQRQNLASYHLARLRDGGLVTLRRSSADGRDTYYSLALTTYGLRLIEAASALHPGLRLAPVPDTPTSSAGRPRGRTVRVLFLCTGNSSRSPMAQGILRQLAATGCRRVEVASAGSQPKPVHPNAVRVMHERGIDISAHRPQVLTKLTERRWDHVISLCDRLRQRFPDFPRGAANAHWSIPDPASAGDGRRSYPDFLAVADGLTVRIHYLLSTVEHTTTSAKG
jgi:protein-tyrosine-phosphatase/DNA-binding transcriptional ArsR family regulator